MVHLKRQKVPKNWPIFRKGSAYLVRPSSNLHSGLPILVVLRDLLKLAQNRKEVKKAIMEQNLLLNGKNIKNGKNAMVLFDVLSIVPSKKNYRLTLTDKGKFTVEEIKDSEADRKIAKVVNKKILKGKKVQLNLSDGRNVLSKNGCRINDSIVLIFKDNKIDRCLEIKSNSNVLVVGGKHAGKRGKIENINEKEKLAEIKTKEDKINALIKHIMVVE